jgi:hypothetical protein
MKKSSVSLDSLLEELSEEKINLVVDGDALRAGGFPGEGGNPCGSGSGSGKSHKSHKSHKTQKSHKTKKHSGSFGGCW